MAAKPANPTSSQDRDKPATRDQPAGAAATGTTPIDPDAIPPALPPARSHPPCDPYYVDVTGKASEDIHVDPDITEGHPGYQESGDSELIPPDRLAEGEGAAGKSGSAC
jgi:hypothetical protein